MSVGLYKQHEQQVNNRKISVYYALYINDLIIISPWGNGLEDTDIEGMYVNKLELRIHNEISWENAQMQHYM